MTVSLENLEAMLETSFRFVFALFEDKDPYKRHQRFLWNAPLSKLGSRTFARNVSQNQSSFSLEVERNEPLPAFREARLIQRLDLAQPAKEIERAVLYWTRQRSGRT